MMYKLGRLGKDGLYEERNRRLNDLGDTYQMQLGVDEARKAVSS